MDFFLFEMFEGKGVMSVALPRMLLLLKNIGVDDIHFIVDVNNRRCLNLINKLPIDEIDNSQWHSSTNGLKPKVFSCPLSTISFKHRSNYANSTSGVTGEMAEKYSTPL